MIPEKPSWLHLPSFPALAYQQREAMEQEAYIQRLAVAFRLPSARAAELFRAYCARQPHDWQTCYDAIMTGRTDWLDAAPVAPGAPE